MLRTSFAYSSADQTYACAYLCRSYGATSCLLECMNKVRLLLCCVHTASAVTQDAQNESHSSPPCTPFASQCDVTPARSDLQFLCKILPVTSAMTKDCIYYRSSLYIQDPETPENTREQPPHSVCSLLTDFPLGSFMLYIKYGSGSQRCFPSALRVHFVRISASFLETPFDSGLPPHGCNG